ncbi:uncharacterized protein C57A10.07-like [Rutidosis leptorrhynchoides]|uniref:uncharacterized protein C57A10.07-like n=1 Tax=Rutidosis leptorrhynchoides TaxID=125765 RepID=UPI003A99940D
MTSYPIVLNSSKSFIAYPIDIEPGSIRGGIRKSKTFQPFTMLKSFVNRIHYYCKLHPLVASIISLSLGLIVVLIVLSLHGNVHYRMSVLITGEDDEYPFAKLKNLVMVAGHSVYISSNCGKVDKEDSWFLESYQRNPGQADTFLSHMEKGVEITAHDDDALLLFSGGETRKEAGPRSEAQSYWTVSDSKGWFGKAESVRWRAMTEEHARDSFENLLFSVCRFRELTGKYPENITVVSYDFKEIRFANQHRSAIRFPESRFFYSGTLATPSSKEAAFKGEALVRSHFLEDPYGCRSSLWRKKLKRDPFHRSIPYPNGCPEIRDLFIYCGQTLYPGSLPWT